MTIHRNSQLKILTMIGTNLILTKTILGVITVILMVIITDGIYDVLINIINKYFYNFIVFRDIKGVV